MATFVSQNPCLEDLTLGNCCLGPAELNSLSEAISQRSADTLRGLDLSENPIGDVDLDKLLAAGNNISDLQLASTGIGLRGFSSLAKLLRLPDCKLRTLHVQNNPIDKEAKAILEDSLAKNAHPTGLHLDVDDGGCTVLKLVCNGSSISNILGSNHVLHSVTMDLITGELLEADDDNLLWSCSDINATMDKHIAVRSKILWSHAREDLNIGTCSSIGNEVIPNILGLIEDTSKETTSEFITTMMRLGGIFHIIKARPELCSYGPTNKEQNEVDASRKRRHDNVAGNSCIFL